MKNLLVVLLCLGSFPQQLYAGFYTDQIHRAGIACTNSQSVNFEIVKAYVEEKIQKDPFALKRLVDNLLVDENAEEIRREIQTSPENAYIRQIDPNKMDMLFSDSDKKQAQKSLRSFIEILKKGWSSNNDAYRVSAIYLDTGIRLLNRSKNGNIPNLNSYVVTTVEKIVGILPVELIGVLNTVNGLIISPSPSNEWVRIAPAVTSAKKDTVYLNDISLKIMQSKIKDKKRDYLFRTIIHELGHMLDAKWSLVNTSSDAAVDTTEFWDGVAGRKLLHMSPTYLSTRPDQYLPAWPGLDLAYAKNSAEVFAEYFSFYMSAPSLIKSNETYGFFNQVVFNGNEFIDVECH